MEDTKVEEIKRQALGLAARERAQLANTLLSSIEHLYEPASDSDEARRAADESARLAQEPGPRN